MLTECLFNLTQILPRVCKRNHLKIKSLDTEASHFKTSCSKRNFSSKCLFNIKHILAYCLAKAIKNSASSKRLTVNFIKRNNCKKKITKKNNTVQCKMILVNESSFQIFGKHRAFYFHKI